MSDIWLARHGQTEWTLSGAHTGSTDLPLTDAGRGEAAGIGRFLAGRSFALVLASPLQRAKETCRIAGYEGIAEIEPDLREWNYGRYEGLTTPEIRDQHPNWSIWDDGPLDGERLEEVAERAQRVIARAASADGDVLLFGHGHALRILASCWLGLPAKSGRLFALGTASVGVLGHERDMRAMVRWNIAAC